MAGKKDIFQGISAGFAVWGVSVCCAMRSRNVKRRVISSARKKNVRLKIRKVHGGVEQCLLGILSEFRVLLWGGQGS